MPTESGEDSDIITCWCGAQGTLDEMFDRDVYGRICYGTGSITCRCGGDFCVCHHHGEIECDGCVDCEPDDNFADSNMDLRYGEAHGRDE